MVRSGLPAPGKEPPKPQAVTGALMRCGDLAKPSPRAANKASCGPPQPNPPDNSKELLVVVFGAPQHARLMESPWNHAGANYCAKQLSRKRSLACWGAGARGWAKRYTR